MSDIADYLHLGVEIANKHVDLKETFKSWPTHRTVVLRICRANPEVSSFLEDWLQLHADNRLKDGAVVEELFNLYMDTSGEQFRLIVGKGMMENPTALVFITDDAFWEVVSRTNTLYTAFITGRQVVVRSTEKADLRDLAHMDLILNVIHRSLQSRGINLASIVRTP